jgi:MSHA pilin protein MshD
MFNKRRARGLTLIEVIVFVVVLGVGFAGMLILYNRVTQASVDPLVRKQALALAQSLLEEIELQPFTFCDPDDPNVYTATSSAACTIPENTNPGAPEALETRYGPTPSDPTATRFDNVNDYNGFAMAGSNPADPNRIRDITNTNIPGLNGYAVNVAVTQISSGEIPGVPDPNVSDALRIVVTATGPTGVTVSLQSYRLRYAPNSP